MSSFQLPEEIQRVSLRRLWFSVILATLIVACLSNQLLHAKDDLTQLKKRWAIEASSAELKQVQAKSYRLLTQGLKYASSKLCPGPERKKLIEANNQLIAKLNSVAKAKKKIADSLGAAAKHLVIAQKHRGDPSRSRLEISLAKDELDFAIDRNREHANKLKQIHSQIIRAEVQYQQVLADCLLGDFMSIFGDGEVPKPEPDVPDDLPDDLSDESLEMLFQDDRLGGFDAPGLIDPEFNPSELFDQGSESDEID